VQQFDEFKFAVEFEFYNKKSEPEISKSKNSADI
jgi:hypothetical protein